MTVLDMMRDAPVGQVIRWLSNRRLFKYPDEQPGFSLPQDWLQLLKEGEKGAGNANGNANPNANANPVYSSGGSSGAPTTITLKDEGEGQGQGQGKGNKSATAIVDVENGNGNIGNPPSKESSEHETNLPAKMTKDGHIIVDWYDQADPENPQNWSNGVRGGALAIISLYTFVVYATSAIYTPSEEGIMERFGVSQIKASLGLAIYVLGYGMGPLLFSPLGEIPRIGRSPVYIITFFLFVVLSIPTAFVSNFPGLIVLRFLTAFFGSPCLASGPASVGDLYSFMALPFMLMIWTSSSFCGPALGPLLSGFAVPAKSWRWSLFESVWASAPVLIAMFLFLPETSADNILLRRAQRLRRLTGSDRLQSQGELRQRDLKPSTVLWDALIKPLQISIQDPAILFVQIYTAIVYGIYYSFFEAFPVVFAGYHGFNAGQIGLVFLCIAVANVLGLLIYGGYLWFYLNPRMLRLGMPVPEARLIPAIPASFFPTVGLFLFAWTASRTIHWIVPTIGITIYAATGFIIFQCIFVYVPLSYQQYAASLFAANAFFRSALAFGSVLFAQPLFSNLGIGKGVSLLGGLSVTGEIGIILLYLYGDRLRAMSKFAVS